MSSLDTLCTNALLVASSILWLQCVSPSAALYTLHTNYLLEGTAIPSSCFAATVLHFPPVPGPLAAPLPLLLLLPDTAAKAVARAVATTFCTSVATAWLLACAAPPAQWTRSTSYTTYLMTRLLHCDPISALKNPMMLLGD
jgi:hypothetical protein